MKIIKNLPFAALAATLLFQTPIMRAAPFGSAFTYQGRLNSSGTPSPNGLYDFRFTLQDAATLGSPVGSAVALSAVPVTNGLFTVQLDFLAPAFTSGEARWLQLQVNTNGLTPLVTLNPRQRLTPAPQAIYAGSATTAATAATASSVAVGAVTSSGLAPGSVGGTAIADGSITSADLNASLLNNTFWKLGGNGGTTAGADFIGTTDNRSLDLRVNNTVALQIRPGVTVPNIVGGLAAQRPSVIASGVSGAVIAGGNAPSGNVTGAGGGDFQAVYDNDGTVGGGFGNKVGSDNGNVTDAAFATIAGGVFNTASSYAATIAGGDSNFADGERAAVLGGFANRAAGAASAVGGGFQNTILNAAAATIGGGSLNTIETLAYRSTIGGGFQNTIQLKTDHATIGGGNNNTIQTNANSAAIGGGNNNTIQNGAAYSTIGGGSQNTIQTNAIGATIPGGLRNSATNNSFAAGFRAKANHTGAFVWADSTDADFVSTANNQFSIRAQGGVRLNSETSLTFGDTGSSRLSPDQGGAIELGNSETFAAAPYIDFHFGFGIPQDYNTRIINDALDQLTIFRSGSSTPMAQFFPGGLFVNGTFVSASDRNLKENFQPVAVRDVLAKVAALPMSRWTYKDDAGTAHLGPMAQDFRAAFGLGRDDKGIATVDADGVALAAIQGLNQKLDETRAENVELKQRLEKLEQLMNRENGGDR